jgi:hypothetical protein
MGKKHREKRKIIKSMLPRGWRENEFGELVRKVSKADVRRAILGRHLLFIEMMNHAEDDVFQLVQRRAIEDIMAAEDLIAFGAINEACYSLSQ